MISLTEKLANLPSRPGVYLMRDKGGKVVYVGKAKDLRARVPVFFRRRGAGNHRYHREALLAAKLYGLQLQESQPAVSSVPDQALPGALCLVRPGGGVSGAGAKSDVVYRREAARADRRVETKNAGEIGGVGVRSGGEDSRSDSGGRENPGKTAYGFALGRRPRYFRALSGRRFHRSAGAAGSTGEADRKSILLVGRPRVSR